MMTREQAAARWPDLVAAGLDAGAVAGAVNGPSRHRGQEVINTLDTIARLADGAEVDVIAPAMVDITGRLLALANGPHGVTHETLGAAVGVVRAALESA